MKYIQSNGGSYLAMEEDHLMKWPGASDRALYDSIPFGADEGLISEVNSIPVVVLGIPDNLHARKLKDGALFATLVCCDNENEIAPVLDNLSDEDWISQGNIAFSSNLVVFDSAIPGGELTAIDCFNLDIAPGEYEALAKNISSDTYEIQLLKLKIKTAFKAKTKRPKTTEDKPIPEKTRMLAYKSIKQMMGENLRDGSEEYYREEGTKLFCLDKNKQVIGSVELLNNDLIVQFKKPKAIADIKDKLVFYTELQPSGWLEFKTLANNKPHSQLEAELGRFLGIFLRENTPPDLLIKSWLGGLNWRSSSREDGSKRIFYKDQNAIASFEKKENEFVIQLKAPLNTQGVEEYMEFYTTLPEPAGWLELKLPADVDEDSDFFEILFKTGLSRLIEKVKME